MVTGTHLCRGCGSSSTEQVVDLGEQPAADFFPPADEPAEDPRWPLQLWLCHSCRLVQLGPVAAMLPEPPLAVESATSLAHAEQSVKALIAARPELAGATVYEFASHHGGSWLDHLRAAGCRVVEGRERAELVVDVHGLAHEHSLAAALRERVDRVAPGGLLLLEFHHLLPLVQGNQFDTIRHGHWSYLSVQALQALCAQLRLTVVDVQQVAVFGGSVQVTFEHTTIPKPAESVAATLAAESAAGLGDAAELRRLDDTARTSASALRDRLAAHRERGDTVLSYGAPSKAPVLLDLAGVGPDLLPFTVDAAPGKHGRRLPGCGVPIRPVDELRRARPTIVLVLTWDIADEVIAQLEADGGWGAQYLVPLPTPHLVAR